MPTLRKPQPTSGLPIVVEGLGKRYRIGVRDERPDTLVGVATSWLKAPFAGFRKLRRLIDFSGTQNDVVWALREVSFTVAPGEVLGLVGANGAGKSTLLKILTRITAPSEGRVWLRGRVASLLEVGTGFHPELTGRENVYLNGTLLGMSKVEVDAKFDEIVAFADIGLYVDTPVKRYSSGMKVRLAFSVAAHLEAEILLVDEVLAVGDIAFQRKCMGKMRDVAGQGRTVILVSHNMAAVRLLCQRALLLEQGRVAADGEVGRVLDGYVAKTLAEEHGETVGETSLARIEKVEVVPAEGSVLKTGEPLLVAVTLVAKKDLARPGLYVAILTNEHHRLAGLDLRDFLRLEPLAIGEQCKVLFRVERNPLMPGPYLLEVYVKEMSGPTIERLERYRPFEVVETAVYGDQQPTRWHGVVALEAKPTVFRSSATGEPRVIEVEP